MPQNEQPATQPRRETKICDECVKRVLVGEDVPTRDCALCGVEICAHTYRGAKFRIDGGEWQVKHACLDPFGCMQRHAARIIL